MENFEAQSPAKAKGNDFLIALSPHKFDLLHLRSPQVVGVAVC